MRRTLILFCAILWTTSTVTAQSMNHTKYSCDKINAKKLKILMFKNLILNFRLVTKIIF